MLTRGTRGTPCSARRKAPSALPSALSSRLLSFWALRSLTTATLAALDSYAALQHSPLTFNDGLHGTWKRPHALTMSPLDMQLHMDG